MITWVCEDTTCKEEFHTATEPNMCPFCGSYSIRKDESDEREN